MLDLPALGIVIGSAAIDSISPCAIGVFILVLSMIIGKSHSTKRLALLGGIYILAVFITYFVIGAGLSYFFAQIPVAPMQYLSIALGVLLMLAGVIQIKDYFWYGKGPSLQIPDKYANKIHDLAPKTTAAGALWLGIFAAIVQFPCTGAPYLAVTAIMKPGIELLALYSLIFVIPLIVTLVLAVGGTKLSRIAKWKDQSKGTMRLFSGLLLAFLSWIIILSANGTINFG